MNLNKLFVIRHHGQKSSLILHEQDKPISKYINRINQKSLFIKNHYLIIYKNKNKIQVL